MLQHSTNASEAEVASSVLSSYERTNGNTEENLGFGSSVENKATRSSPNSEEGLMLSREEEKVSESNDVVERETFEFRRANFVGLLTVDSRDLSRSEDETEEEYARYIMFEFNLKSICRQIDRALHNHMFYFNPRLPVLVIELHNQFMGRLSFHNKTWNDVPEPIREYIVDVEAYMASRNLITRDTFPSYFEEYLRDSSSSDGSSLDDDSEEEIEELLGKDSRFFDRHGIVVKDFNRAANDKALLHLVKFSIRNEGMMDFYTESFRGYILYRGDKWPFVLYADHKTIEKCFERLMKLDNIHIRKLRLGFFSAEVVKVLWPALAVQRAKLVACPQFLSGAPYVLHPSLERQYELTWCREFEDSLDMFFLTYILDPLKVMCKDARVLRPWECTIITIVVYVLLAPLFPGYCGGWELLMINVFVAFVKYMGWRSDHLSYVTLEEIFKAYIGLNALICWEVSERACMNLRFSSLIPILFHGYLYFLPFPLRVIFHYFWNRMSTRNVNRFVTTPALYDQERVGQRWQLLEFRQKMVDAWRIAIQEGDDQYCYQYLLERAIEMFPLLPREELMVVYSGMTQFTLPRDEFAIHVQRAILFNDIRDLHREIAGSFSSGNSVDHEYFDQCINRERSHLSVEEVITEMCTLQVHGTFGLDKLASGSVIGTDVPDVVSNVCCVLDVLWKIYKRDSVGLGLSLGMHFPYFKEMFLDEIDVLMVLSSELIENGEEEVLLGFNDSVEQSPKLGFLTHWLPENVKHSPTFKRTLALVGVLFTSRFFRSSSVMTAIGRHISFDDLMDGGDLLSLIVKVVSSTYRAAYRVMETGNLSYFWDMPADVEFTIEAKELLQADKSNQSMEEIMDDIVLARNLIDRRRFLKNDSSISRLIEKLEIFMAAKKEFVKNQARRRQGNVIWMMGPPGTGKSNLQGCLIDRFAKRDKVPRAPGDVLSLNVYDKYPISSNINQDAPYLIMNDIPNNFVDFPLKDLLPLDVLLQQIFDEFALYFRAAAVEDKGKAIRKLKYTFISANHMSYVCPGETPKLQRRLENGILVDVYVVDDKGKKVDFKTFKDYDQGTRNDRWRFNILEVECKDKHIVFTRTQKILKFDEFVSYAEERIDKWERYQDVVMSKFSEGAVRCSCGMALALHETQFLDRVDGMGSGTKMLKALTKDCDDYFTFDIDDDSYSALMLSGSVNMPLGEFLLAATLVWLFLGWEPLKYEYYRFMDRTVLDYVRDAGVRFAITNPVINRIIENGASTMDKYRFRAWKAYHKFKNLVLEYSPYFPHFALSGGALFALYKLIPRQTKEAFETLTMAPIYRQNVVKESVGFIDYSREMNFPEIKLRDWSKQAQEMKIINLHTVGTSLDDLIKMVESQTKVVRLERPSMENEPIDVEVTVFLLSPELMVINKHYLDRMPSNAEAYMTLDGVRRKIDLDQLKSTGDVEAFVWRHPFPTFARGLHNFLPEKPVNGLFECYRVDKKEKSVAAPSTFTGNHGIVYKCFQFPSECNKGDCGNIVLGLVTGGAFIAGMISVGKRTGTASYCGCTLLSREWLNEVEKGNPFPFVEDIQLLGVPELEHLSLKSEARNLISPFVVPVGTLPGSGRTFTSKLRRTRIYGEVAPLARDTYAIPAKTRTVEHEKQIYQSVFTHTFKNVNMDNDMTLTEENFAVKTYVERFASVELRNVKLSPVSFEDAIFGREDIGLDRINFKSSCGKTLKKYGVINKYDLFETDSQGLHLLKEDVQVMVKNFDRNMFNHICELPYVLGTVKDEIRTAEKVLAAKLRMFMVLDFVFNIWGRMMLMPLILLMMQFPHLSGCYGGMNAGSDAWNVLANFLKEHPNFFDADFSTFDVSHDKKAFRMFAKTMFMLALRFGMTLEEASAIYIYVYCLCVQVFEYSGDLYLKFKGMPSGVIITLIMNSVVNVEYSIVVFNRITVKFYRAPAYSVSYFENTRIATVGDDNVTSVANKYKEFNMINIQSEYKKLGYVVTPADKGGKIVAFLSFEELTFLKRWFRWTEELGYVAPIDKDSVLKALMFESKEIGVSSEQRLYDAAMGAQREMFLHGKQEFLDFQTWIYNILAKHKIFIELLNYDSLVNEYKAKGFRTFAL